MYKRFIIYVIYFWPLIQFAQDFSALWTGYFSYNNIKIVTKGTNKIFGAAENAVFSFDTQTNELQELTTVNGLSGETITNLYYSETYQLLVIGYENGLIEIAFDNEDNILSLVDIFDKATIPPSNKRINHFYAQGNLLYISTNYGITVFNLERLEFGDTYLIGDNGSQIQVNQMVVFQDYIYAACSLNNGIRKAPITSPNLINYNRWEKIATGNFSSIQAGTDKLYAIRTDKKLFQITNNNFTELYLYQDTPLDFKVIEDNLVITTIKNTFIYNSSFNLISQVNISTDFNTNYNASVTDLESIYIATTHFGILKTPLLNPTIFESIHPQGPILNTPFSIKAEPNGVWVTYGDYTLFYNPSPIRLYGVSHLENNKWLNISKDSIFNARNLNAIAVNPNKPKQVFISSFQDGILEINNNKPTILHNQTNSSIESVILPNDPTLISLRLSGLIFDDDGVLWSISSIIKKPLNAYNPATKEWRSFDFSKIINNPLKDNIGFNQIAIDQFANVFITSYSKGLIGYNPNNGNPLIKNIEEESNLPINSVRSVAVDKRNQIWIGTHKGLRILYNPASFFTDDDVMAEDIIILEDGIAKELLFQEFISDIEVDGSNNKWIGTFGAGVFYLSFDGQKTIYHFTKNNSPLPSNNISDISIDDSLGIIYIATDKGLVSFKSGGSSPFKSLNKAYVYPNPVRPRFNIVDNKVKIKDISENVNIKITDIEGNLVAEAQTGLNKRYSGYNLEIDGGTAYWNGKNLANKVVATGVYLVMLSDLDSFETNVLKIMVIR